MSVMDETDVPHVFRLREKSLRGMTRDFVVLDEYAIFDETESFLDTSQTFEEAVIKIREYCRSLDGSI